jgi:spore maturation protein CgeB
MAENQESPSNIIENLALVTDAIQTIFPDGKIICVYELNNEDFKKVQENFRKIDHTHKRFSIDISGLENVFIHENFQEEVTTDNKIIEKKTNSSLVVNIKNKLSSWFVSGVSSIK